MTDFLRYEQDGNIVILTMDQPETRNALTGNTAVAEFKQACKRISEDLSVRAVIIRAEGPSFCAGGNVKNMNTYIEADTDPFVIRNDYLNGIQQLTKAVCNLEVPVIAAVHSHALGAGCDLACMADIRICSEDALFAESFVKVGLIPGDGGSWLLPRVVGYSKAAEMAFTGDMIDAQEALACGLVSRVVPKDELLDAAMTLARRIVCNPGHALRMAKRLLREGQMATLDSMLEMAAASQALAHKTAHHKEAVTAFIEKRKPNFAD